ncbi:uncharacterized protein L969DRAFT_106191 [Mixia osmundae IAM 14324]|uniref:AAA+ ATPase domain-containing protein n=1 Tax=Mixia osmundae (strain CBS 9802 / IAM 14324 / JCM 22182 / KY 12970) TaxID=764103 RepID=G7DWQ1_MIXOS|nr:uncharacterized protein L969DRAFT_106191 [Mixia osmundae IAM 14324]KEI36223.1 hypothetical protein L969DRAFT_106191 [Mixia osmundae IAM 14324]GAA94998.1 hypothetical protein E5Q_01653 [Mixia osmundae IAM 14324]
MFKLPTRPQHAQPSPSPPSHSEAASMPPSPSGSEGIIEGAPARDRGWAAGLLAENPYFSAGFGLMGVGAVLAVARKGMVQAATMARRRMLVSLEISSKDPAYLWFLKWMDAQTSPSALAQATRFNSHQLAVETSQETRGDGGAETSFTLVPGPGTHYLRWRSAWFQIKRERDGKMMDLTSGTPWETVTLVTLSRDRPLFSVMLTEARELAKAAQVGKTVIYTAWGPEWRPFGQPRARRLLDSVVLDQGTKERIVDDVTDFMARGTWYAERGIPYRRGYLLHGPPGSGKSSFITALAGSLDYNICVLNLSERGLTDDKLNHLLANAPERSILLLEDIDAAFAGRDQTAEGGFRGNVTFSGLLNALDGVASSSAQRIMFMTTNHVELLDPALIRPGRVDLLELLDDATSYQAGELYSRFYRDHPDVSSEDLTRAREQVEQLITDGAKISMAALQGHFIRHGPLDALTDWRDLIATSGQRDQEQQRPESNRIANAHIEHEALRSKLGQSARPHRSHRRKCPGRQTLKLMPQYFALRDKIAGAKRGCATNRRKSLSATDCSAVSVCLIARHQGVLRLVGRSHFKEASVRQ